MAKNRRTPRDDWRPIYIQFKDENIRLSSLFGEKVLDADIVSHIFADYIEHVVSKYKDPDKASDPIKLKDKKHLRAAVIHDPSLADYFMKYSFKDCDTTISDIMGKKALNTDEFYKRFNDFKEKHCVVPNPNIQPWKKG